MVEQGTIIKVNFDPKVGHERAGFRPAVVVSNNIFNEKTNLTIVCPITNTNNDFPLHIALDNRTKTTGFILCEHIKALDLRNRKYKYVEELPYDLKTKLINTIYSEIEIM